MNRPSPKLDQIPPEDPKRISKWTRAYAQNRTLGVVVFMVIFLVLTAAIGFPSYLAGIAWRSGNMPLLIGCLVVLVLALAALFYISVPRWGGPLQERIVARLYAKEGNASFSVPTGGRKIWATLLAVFLGTSIMGSILIDSIYEIPSMYRQPISALYCVPFLVGIWFIQRPMQGYLTLLWPALYTTHAILIVAGAPILFTGRWDVLNMLIPVAGYGLLTGLLGHLYSRIALHRLKSLAHIASEPGTDMAQEDRQ
jgi:hypothetical protein